MRRNPYLYEINTCLYLKEISGKYLNPVTMAAIPEEEWRSFSRLGIDFIWLMGVWQRSPASRQIAVSDPGLRREYAKVLPDWSPGDIGGSPYAVYSYSLEPALGRKNELATLKSKLNRYGLGLVLDFVPNHLAIDHPWTLSHPGRFVQGNQADVRRHPDWFFQTAEGRYLAHGRDPNFSPWTDTAQLNFYSADLRNALIRELLQVSEVADGVRCDMAMLALNDVFGRVWQELIPGGALPVTEFWAEAISRVRRRVPGFLFISEAYWDLEEKLQELGFDFTYDMRFYHKLRDSSPEEIRRYLAADHCPERSVRFIENHDEPRAVTAFGRERSLAAAVILCTIPGLRFLHHGQLSGSGVRPPVQLARAPEESVDSEIMRFYQKLLAICNRPVFRDGIWQLLETAPAGEGNNSWQNMLAWSWQYERDYKIVIINYSPTPAQGRLKMPPKPAGGGSLSFLDELTGITYIRQMEEVYGPGIYIDLAPYRAHLFSITDG